MKVIPLAQPERAQSGYTHLVQLLYTDLTDTAGLTKTIHIYPETGQFTVPFKCRCDLVKVVTAFAGCTTLVAEVGIDGATNGLLAQQNLKTAENTIRGVAGGLHYVTANEIDVLVTATVDNLSALTAGEAWFGLECADLDLLLPRGSQD